MDELSGWIWNRGIGLLGGRDGRQVARVLLARGWERLLGRTGRAGEGQGRGYREKTQVRRTKNSLFLE